jgi:ADP-ribose pyrophosphatase YjhB (NUDIX family)
MSYDNPPEHIGWQLTRVGQGILVDGDSVLLSGNRWFSGKPLVWTLPGGRAEEGEGIEQALVREFKEETGLDVQPSPLAYVVEARSTVRKQIFLTCAFLVTSLSGELSHEGDDTVEELRFVHLSDLPLYLPSPSIGDPLRWYFSHPSDAARYWFFPEYTAE